LLEPVPFCPDALDVLLVDLFEVLLLVVLEPVLLEPVLLEPVPFCPLLLEPVPFCPLLFLQLKLLFCVSAFLAIFPPFRHHFGALHLFAYCKDIIWNSAENILANTDILLSQLSQIMNCFFILNTLY